MYKKRIHLWKFDVKNHKLSTIQAAEAVRNQHLDRGEEFRVFEVEGRKPITEAGYKRYKRRRRNAATNSDSIPQELDIQSARNSLAVIPVIAVPGRRACRCPRCHHQARKLFLSRRQVVRLTEITAPDLHRYPEQLFSALKFCLESSYRARLWSVSEYGFYRKTRPARWHPEINPRKFVLLFGLANKLLTPDKMRSARRIFTTALLSFREFLFLYIPVAIASFLDILGRFLHLGELEYAKFVIKSTSTMINQESWAGPALQQIFTVLAATSFDALRCALPRIFKLHSKCIEGLDSRLYQAAVSSRSISILYDEDSDLNGQVSQLISLLAGVRLHPAGDCGVGATCVGALLRAHSRSSGHFGARKIAEETCRLVEPYLDVDTTNVFLIEVLANTLLASSRAFWAEEMLMEAIEAKILAIDHMKRAEIITIEHLRSLASMQRALQKDQEALSFEKVAEEMIHHFATLDIQDASGVPVSCVSEAGSNECGDTCIASHCHNERPENGCISEDEIVGVEGKKEASPVWKEGLSQAQQTELTLPVLYFDSDMEIQ
jgi:hypothetical protein